MIGLRRAGYHNSGGWDPFTLVARRAQRFYEDKVGLVLSPETIKNHLVFECGDGTSLLIYGRPSGNKADHTQVRFWCTEPCQRSRFRPLTVTGRGFTAMA